VWGVSLKPWPLFTPKKDPVPIVQEAGWVPGPVWTGAKNLAHTGSRCPNRPAGSHSLYRLHYPAHVMKYTGSKIIFAKRNTGGGIPTQRCFVLNTDRREFCSLKCLPFNPVATGLCKVPVSVQSSCLAVITHLCPEKFLPSSVLLNGSSSVTVYVCRL